MALWQQLHGADEALRLPAARQLLETAEAYQVPWLFEWLANGYGKNRALPPEGLQLLCSLLDALSETYPLQAHVPWLMTQLREPDSGKLLERLLRRPALAFRPSVEQAMPIFQAAKKDGSGPRSRLGGLVLAAREPLDPKFTDVL
ncbi:unnamed protein product [Effrenium voratum]|nr:unnamed protein product [Effrenium voratum]